ncbi:hypothetical protein T552_00219 [Pneumocystis carinii B80]|uniref:DASH complex subunit DAM1 n=1 Tax=Pneumocystis carinii (strain B80) TaxID=1408658 RepID=A0A0W4ZT84_PNEC8|nr:hypothetical protein T552_00219 [Pneumocystis carinii B80]KTW31581.1 hypothetical protein T552_00219 [Pneumocystis carinii B80]
MPFKSKSRPTTPLRRIEKGSLSHLSSSRSRQDPFPLDSLAPAFAEMTDALIDVQQNFEHVQSIHSNLVRFSESFASFLYGLNMNAFCVDFPEAPVQESFKRAQNDPNYTNTSQSTPSRAWNNQNPQTQGLDLADTTFTTNETSFIERPSKPSKTTTSKRNNKSDRTIRTQSSKTRNTSRPH